MYVVEKNNVKIDQVHDTDKLQDTGEGTMREQQKYHGTGSQDGLVTWSTLRE